MRGHHQAHVRARWCQRDGWAIVERPCHAAFWMRAYLIWGTRKDLFDDLQIQQVIGTTSDDYPEMSREYIEERSGIAI